METSHVQCSHKLDGNFLCYHVTIFISGCCPIRGCPWVKRIKSEEQTWLGIIVQHSEICNIKNILDTPPLYVYLHQMCSWIPYNKNLMSVVCTNFYGFQYCREKHGDCPEPTFMVSNFFKLDIDLKFEFPRYFWNIWSLINRDSYKTINFIETNMKYMIL